MWPKLEHIDLYIVPSNLEYVPNSKFVEDKGLVIQGGDWRFYIFGPWMHLNTEYCAEFGILSAEGILCDGFRIALDAQQITVHILPQGLGQVRCYVGLNEGIFHISSKPLPYKNLDEMKLKGNYVNALQGHSLDWGNFIGGGQLLRHGEELIWKDGRISTHYGSRFYPNRISGRKKVTTQVEAVEALGLGLTEAVQRAIGKHEKVALHVSGGVDSAAIAACASLNKEVELKIFSWNAENKSATEARFVKEIADKLGLSLCLVRPENELSSYDPDTFHDVIEANDLHYNPFRFLVRHVLRRSADEGFHYGLNGNAGDNVVAVPAYFALVEAWQDGRYRLFFEMMQRLTRLLGFRNLNRVQAFRYWGRMLLGKSLIDFPVSSEPELMALRDNTVSWPEDLDRNNPKHGAYWKLTCGDGLFPLASALTYSYKNGCFAHTPYFDYEFLLRMQDIPGYLMNHPNQFKLLSRKTFEGFLPDSITKRPYRRGNLNPIMDSGYRHNRLKLRQYLLDHRSLMAQWRWWDELEKLLDRENQPIRGPELAFLHRAIVRIASIHRNFEEMR